VRPSFENFKSWVEECFNPSFRRQREQARLMLAEEERLNPYQQRILAEIRDLAENGPPELWAHSLEKVGGMQGDPGIVLRRTVEDETHILGVRETRTGDLDDPLRDEYFVQSFKNGEREAQFFINNSATAEHLFKLIKKKTPFNRYDFELIKSPPPKIIGGSPHYDIAYAFFSPVFQLGLKSFRENDKPAHDRRATDKKQKDGEP